MQLNPHRANPRLVISRGVDAYVSSALDCTRACNGSLREISKFDSAGWRSGGYARSGVQYGLWVSPRYCRAHMRIAKFVRVYHIRGDYGVEGMGSRGKAMGTIRAYWDHGLPVRFRYTDLRCSPAKRQLSTVGPGNYVLLCQLHLPRTRHYLTRGVRRGPVLDPAHEGLYYIHKHDNMNGN